MNLEDRVRELEAKAFTLRIDNELLLLVFAEALDKILPSSKERRLQVIGDMESRIGTRIQNIKSGMAAVETDAYTDEMRQSAKRVFAALRGILDVQSNRP
jgi:hypothetical protein